MKTFRINLNKENEKLKKVKYLKIVPIADVHKGDKLLDYTELNKTVKYIKDNPDVYTILNGDLMNTAIKSSVSDCYEDTMTPMEQIESLVKLLEPIKHKILVATTGNHERRIKRESSIDIMQIVMAQLGLSNRYTSGAYYLFLYFGEKEQGRKAPMVYTIYGYHGSGGGRKAGGKLNKVIEMAEKYFADVYLMSHVHVKMGTKQNYFIPDFGNKALVEKEMAFVISNSYLFHGGYGEDNGYNIATRTRIEIELNGKYREKKIII